MTDTKIAKDRVEVISFFTTLMVPMQNKKYPCMTQFLATLFLSFRRPGKNAGVLLNLKLKDLAIPSLYESFLKLQRFMTLVNVIVSAPF